VEKVVIICSVAEMQGIWQSNRADDHSDVFRQSDVGNRPAPSRCGAPRRWCGLRKVL
jgi:hypothetical protein